MNEIHSTPKLAKALISFILAAKPIAKTMEVGTGQNSYKAVSDKEVKEKLGKLLAENQLCILPIEINANETHLETDDRYNPGLKKLSIFESGESQVLVGYGHGVDPQDKAAGKATTYALKYLLIYLSLAPTGGLDDSDNDHSEDPKTVPPVSRFSTPPPSREEKKEGPKAQAPAPKAPAPKATTTTAAPAQPQAPADKWALKVGDEKWGTVVNWVISNKEKGLDFCINALKKKNDFGADIEKELSDHMGLPF